MTKGDTIKPRYMYPTHRNIALLGELISLFKSARGCKRGELESILETYESGLEFKTIRCIKVLLLRRCEFVSRSVIDPVEARRVVFREASRIGVTSGEEREDVIKRSACALNVTPEELESSLWADLEEEQILSAFKDIDPLDLLRLFNLSITQTLLFKARKMEIRLSSIDIGIIDTLKRLGLMYSAEKRDGMFWIEVEGPLSTVKHCERYGVQMAKVIPEVVRLPSWEIRAEISWKGEKHRIFEVRSEGEGRLIKYTSNEDESPVVEGGEKEWLLRKLKEGLPGWEVTPDPGQVILGNAVFHPDLMVSKGDIHVYLEVLGFWTEDFLRKHASLCAHQGDITYIPIVDQAMRCSDKGSVGQGILLFDRRSIINDIVSALKKIESVSCAGAPPGKPGSEEAFSYPVTGDILDLNALAREHKTSEENIIRALEPRGYIRVGSVLISKRVAERITSELIGGKRYLDAVKVITDAGIPLPDEALRRLGFAVIWHGLDPEKAEVRFIG